MAGLKSIFGPAKDFFAGETSIHRKIRVSFSLLVLLTVVLCAVICRQIYSFSFYGCSADSGLAISAGSSLLISVLSVSIVLIVSLVFFMMYLVRTIADPLREMEKATEKLAAGDLDLLISENETVQDPISQIGENIHDLAINLQEILLLIWNISDEDINVLEELMDLVEKGNCHHENNCLDKIKFLKEHREMTQEMVQQFELFNVTLQDNKLLSSEDTDTL
jgi:methyl-accepting chemotaxis protein